MRTVSTAFQRALMNLRGGKHFHEPYAAAYYYGPDRKSARYLSRPVQPKATLGYITEELAVAYDGKEFLHCVDRAYHLDGNYGILCHEGLSEFKHTFLIRNPKKVIRSLYRGIINSHETGWNFFDPEEIGFRQLLELYEFVVKEFDSSPIVIDADDLLESPEEMMKKYCEGTGLVYQENMTTWEPGSVPEWDSCQFNGWHDDVIRSTGLGKRVKKKKEDIPFTPSVEREINDLDEAHSKFYMVLYEKRLRLIEKPNLPE